jgi:tRNA1Val (adenine37-N6)-methyltransferase
MKIGTDGVLLGAWAVKGHDDIKHVLDIGTGTGLIALMIAQRFEKACVDAIDINAYAVALAKSNFEKSLWSNRLKVFQSTPEAFKVQKKYDLIVSNPPFFTKSGIINNPNRHFARDVESLAWKQILNFSKSNLNKNGRIEVIYPHELLDELVQQAKEFDFFAVKITEVIPKPSRSIKRILLSFGKSVNLAIKKDQLIIENEERHSYHEDYKNLCQDFYLKF